MYHIAKTKLSDAYNDECLCQKTGFKLTAVSLALSRSPAEAA